MGSQKELLLVDANIISHALTDNQTPAYVKLFEKLEQQYKFVVTGFTKYEVTCTSDKDHKEKISEYLEQNMAYVELSKPLMDFAAKICFLYQKHPSTKAHKITMGDIVNAAFAIAKPCCILTIDNMDYPLPFFMEVAREHVSYASKKGNEVTDVAHILKPDIDNTKQCFQTHQV
jgi:predicted nucleic acid-binding protein